jgi:hypothetical protein
MTPANLNTTEIRKIHAFAALSQALTSQCPSFGVGRLPDWVDLDVEDNVLDLVDEMMRLGQRFFVAPVPDVPHDFPHNLIVVNDILFALYVDVEVPRLRVVRLIGVKNRAGSDGHWASGFAYRCAKDGVWHYVLWTWTRAVEETRPLPNAHEYKGNFSDLF